MNFGVVNVDCTGLVLTNTEAQEIEGIYGKCKEALETGKALVAYNCKWENRTVSPIMTFGIDFGTYFIFTVSTLQIRVGNDDKITIINMAPDAD